MTANDDYDKLTQKQKAFVDHYISTGNATEAARLAGYKQPQVQGAQNLEKLSDFIQPRLQEIESERIANMEEINAFWSAVMRDPTEDMRNRLKASELRAKVEGAFIEKIEHSGSIDSIAPELRSLNKDELRRLIEMTDSG